MILKELRLDKNLELRANEMHKIRNSSSKELTSQRSTENTGKVMEFSSVDFMSLPPHLKRRLFVFDAGGIYSRGIFLNIPLPRDADFEILDEGRRLRVYPRRELSPAEMCCIGVAVERAGVMRLHFITAEGELIQGE